MRIYRGTMQNLPIPAPQGFPLCHPCCTGFSPSGKSCFSFHLEGQKGNFSVGWGAELQRKVRPHGKAHLVICSNQSDDPKSLFGCSFLLSSCTPTRLLTLALTTALSRVIQLTGLVSGWECKTREVDCHPWLYDLFSFPFNPCFSQHGQHLDSVIKIQS